MSKRTIDELDDVIASAGNAAEQLRDVYSLVQSKHPGVAAPVGDAMRSAREAVKALAERRREYENACVVVEWFEREEF